MLGAGIIRALQSVFAQSARERRSSAEGGEPDERSNLLPKPNGGDSESPETVNGATSSHKDDSTSQWRLIWTEFKVLIQGSVPVILAYTLQMSLQTFSILVVGRTSPENLATAAFAYMFAMVTGYLIALGGTTALDTLASSSFTGSQDKHDLGVLLQKSFLVLGVFYVPVIVIWILAEPLFLALGQDPQISHDSARFLWCLIPGGLGYIYFECMKKYLQAQGKFNGNFQQSSC